MSQIKVKSLLIQAKKLKSENDFYAALELINQAYKLNPYNAEVIFEKGNIYKSLKNYDEALDSYQKALKFMPNNHSIEFELANTFLLKGSLVQAEDLYKSILKKHKTFLLPLKKLGDLYLEKNDLENAEKYYLNYLSLEKSNPESLKSLKNFYFFTKDYNKALGVFIEKAKSHKEQLQVNLIIADIYYNLQDYNKALSIYNKILTQDKNNIETLSALANLNFQLKNYNESINYSLKAISLEKNFNNILLAGKSYFKLKDYENAEKYFQDTISLDMTNFEAWKYLGFITFNKKDYAHALNCFQKAFKINETDIDNLKYLSSTYQALGNKDEAINYYELVLKLEPNNKILLPLSKLYESKNNYEASLIYLLRYVKNEDYKIDDDVELKLISLFIKNKMYSEALERANLFPDSNNLHLNYYKAVCLFNKKEFNLCIELFEKCNQDNIRKLSSLDYIFKSLIEIEDYNKALKIANEILDLELNNETKISALNNVAFVYIKLKDYDKAIITLEELISNGVQDNETLTNLATIYLERQEYEKALELFEKCQIDEQTIYNIGFCNFKLKNYNESKIYFEKLLKEYPESFTGYYGMSLYFEQEKNFNKAINLLNKAINFDETLPEVFIELFHIYLYLESGKEAENILEKGFKKHPESKQLLNEFGMMKYNNQKYQEALEAFETLLERDPDNLDIMSYTAVCFYHVKNYIKSEELINKVLETNPNDIKSMIYLSLILSVKKEFLKAEEVARESVVLSNGDYESYFALGKIYEAWGRLEDAIWAFQKVTARVPDHYLAFKGIGDCYFNLKLFSASIKSYENALNINPVDDDVIINLGFSYEGVNEFSKAMELFEKYQKLNPSHATVTALISKTYFNRGNFIRASEFIEKYFLSELNPKEEFYILAGDIYYRLNDLERTHKYYSKGFEKYPESIICGIRFGNLLYERNELNSSYNIFQSLYNLYPQNYDIEILYAVTGFATNNFDETHKKAYTSVIEKERIYFEPDYLLKEKLWCKNLILKIPELLKVV